MNLNTPRTRPTARLTLEVDPTNAMLVDRLERCITDALRSEPENPETSVALRVWHTQATTVDNAAF